MGNYISSIRHPEYSSDHLEWMKWRLAYYGGREFINHYLTPLSKRETDDDFNQRKQRAYVPKFAAAALNKIKNAIYQRMTDVARVGGPKTYQEAVKGQKGGVDLRGSSMDTFIGRDILKELLVMRRVGILMDAPKINGTTLKDKGDKHPFLTYYESECILSWKWEYVENVRRYTNLLLKESIEVDSEYGLPSSRKERYRHLYIKDSRVHVDFYERDGEQPYNRDILTVDKIPFTMPEIPCSLMQDIADYQAALMNLESSDVSYALKSNYPFYYEFYDPKVDPVNLKPLSAPGTDGSQSAQETTRDPELKMGATQGRRFAKGLESPGFVNPSAETLKVSMEKGEQIKQDIYRLVNLNLENAAKSAESKQEDNLSLESSLSFIGVILQQAENEIGEFWKMFENEGEVPKVTYPENYSLKTEEERQTEAEKLSEMKDKVPSDKYRRAVAKKIATLTIGRNVSHADLMTIHKEIDNAPTLTSDPDQIIADHKEGLVSDETASLARGYKKGEVEQAKKDHAERLKRIMEAQGGPDNASAARGVKDVDGQSSSAEKQGKEQRGTADKVIKE